MAKIGVVGVLGGWSSERLADAVRDKTGFRLLIEMDHVYYDSDSDTVWFNNHNLLKLDGLIIKKIAPHYSPYHRDRLEMLRFLKHRGLAIYSNPDSIMECYDRLSCTLKLQAGGIPMPSTVVTEDIQQAIQAVDHFGEAVIKPLFSSKARGMQIIKSGTPGLEDKLKSFKDTYNPAIYLQKKVEIPGKDLGLAFLGGKYLATYARVAHKDSWNTTTVNGGKYEPFEPSPEIIQLAEKAQALFDLSFTCVDVVETADGPMVFEVSAFGGFRGLLNTWDIDVAGRYAQFVIDDIANKRNSLNLV